MKDKRVLLTGATGDIGAAIAQKLIDAGAMVMMSGTRENRLQELQEKLGERALYQTCNLSDAESIQNLLSVAHDKMGGVDVLIHNAGITKDNLLLRLKDDDFDVVMNVNFTAGVRLARGLLKGMMKQRYGRMVFITSVVGHAGNPGQSNYVASKAALNGFAKSLAAEVASRNITVNCVAPGFIATDMTAVLGDDVKEKIMGSIPLGKMGTPEEIAGPVAFLASDDAAYMTGTTLHVNGGMYMGA